MKNLSAQVGVYRRSDTNNLQVNFLKYPPVPIGKQFGKWVVLENDWYVSSKKYTDRACLVRCQCGVERVVTYRALRNGISTSCLKCRARPTWLPARNIECIWNSFHNSMSHRGKEFHFISHSPN
jgi:hypothetical protein